MTRSSEHRAGEKSARRRKEILDTAARLFAADGYEFTTIAAIAESTGLGTGSLYYYVQSKEELLFRVILRNHELLHDFVAQAPGLGLASLAPLEAIRVFVDRHVQYTLENREASALYQRHSDVIRAVGPWWDLLSAARLRHELLLTSLIETAQQTGHAHPSPGPALAARALLDLANGAHRWFQPTGSRAATNVSRDYAMLAVRSLRAESDNGAPEAS